MNKINCLILTIVATIGSVAFAENSADLSASLSAAGAGLEVAMGRAYVAVDNLTCGVSHETKDMECSFTDRSSENDGKTLKVSGKKADDIVQALEAEWPYDPAGVYELIVESISCSSSMNDLVDIEKGEVWTCNVKN